MGDIVKNWTQWLASSRFSYMDEAQKQQTLLWLSNVRDKVLDKSRLKAGDTVIDIGTGSGLLSFGAYERLNGTGKVIVSDAFADCVEQCRQLAGQCGIEENMEFLQTDALDIKLPENSVDVVMMRSVLVHIIDKQTAINEFYRILRQNGRISIFEPIIRKNTKYQNLVNSDTFPNYKLVKIAEDRIFSDENDPLMNFDEQSLENNFKKAGFKNIDVDIQIESSTYQAKQEMIEPWFNTPPSPDRATLRQKFLEYMSENDVNDFINALKIELDGKMITLNSPVAYIYAEK